MDHTDYLLQVLSRCLSLASHQIGGTQEGDLSWEAPGEPTIGTDVTAPREWTPTASATATPQETVEVVPRNQEMWQAMEQGAILANATSMGDALPGNTWATYLGDGQVAQSQFWRYDQGVSLGDKGDTFWQGDTQTDTVNNQSQAWSQRHTQTNTQATQTNQTTSGNQATVTVNPTIQIYATVREEADLDTLVTRITQMLDEEIASSAERAYT